MEILYQFNRGWDKTNELIDLLRIYKKNIYVSSNNIRILFSMIPYSRDIYFGKGERDLSYRMIYAWYQVFPVLALKAIHLLFYTREGLPPVGSWCDVKFFCVFIEKISPLGLHDPLILAVASIANRQLRLDLSSHTGISNVAKWIPRESNHRDLFSVFVRDWFSIDLISDVKKKIYRKIVSGLSSRLPVCHSYSVLFSNFASGKDIIKGSGIGTSFPSLFIGEYVKAALRIPIIDPSNKDIEWIEYEWRRLLRTFPSGSYGVSVVDLGLSNDKLYHALGYACLISEKMGIKRILLAGSVPIWVDVSLCNGFVSMVHLLWYYCEGRCGSQLSDSILFICEGVKYIFEGNLKLFVFSDDFSFDWTSFSKRGNRIVPIFWNMGTSFHLPNDGSETAFIYMSGYASGLLIPFCSFITNDIYKRVLDSYVEWYSYLDIFFSQVLHVDSVNSDKNVR